MSEHVPLLFIDTNIYLDFYRATGSADFKLFERLEKVHDKIISSAQVEMEFQKNRQELIRDAFVKLKLKDRPEIPGLFVNSTLGEELQNLLDQIDKKLKTLKKSLSAAMESPAEHDPVYKAAKQIFSFESDFNLTRAKSERFRIRRLARKRYLLGYPPRKDSDTSIGDAVNWEWIIECAKKSGRSVVIVTRDGDYGLRFDKQSYLNEWLRQEFSERVGGRSEITLTDSLSEALKRLGVPVTKAEIESERKLIETGEPQAPSHLSLEQIFNPTSAWNITPPPGWEVALEVQKKWEEFNRMASIIAQSSKMAQRTTSHKGKK
jgi:hypothetical protein